MPLIVKPSRVKALQKSGDGGGGEVAELLKLMVLEGNFMGHFGGVWGEGGSFRALR